MNKTLQLVLGAAALLAFLWAFSAVAGVLIKGAVIVGAGAIAFVVVRSWWRERQEQRGPKPREQKRLEKSAGQTIEELKREVESARRS